MSSTHFRKGSLFLEKKLPSLMDLVHLHCLHRHTSPSLTSCLLPSTMGTAHLAQLEDEESSPFLLNQLTRSSEGPKITGPNSNRDITSYNVLPAFVMRARLISIPHYVRLHIIAIHCDFSSESYIHIWASEASPTLGCSIEISRDISLSTSKACNFTHPFERASGVAPLVLLGNRHE